MMYLDDMRREREREQARRERHKPCAIRPPSGQERAVIKAGREQRYTGGSGHGGTVMPKG